MPFPPKTALFAQARVPHFAGIFFCCLLPGAVFSQAITDTLSGVTEFDGVRSLYSAQIGESSPLYNGVQFIRDGRKATGFPFFDADGLSTGTVTLSGFTHHDVAMQYDLVGDDIVAENPGLHALFRIPKQKVNGFSIGAHRFVHLRADSTKGAGLRDGYYEAIAAGDFRLLVRREKKLETRPGYDDPEYALYTRYFIIKNNRYLPVDGKKSLLAILDDRKDAVKQFLRSQSFNFKKNPGAAYEQTLRFYAGLKH